MASPKWHDCSRDELHRYVSPHCNATTPPALVPDWAGQFKDFQQWVNRAGEWLEGAVCVDALGRHCFKGKEFMRARDEGTFPVRFFWHLKTAPDATSDLLNELRHVLSAYVLPERKTCGEAAADGERIKALIAKATGGGA